MDMLLENKIALIYGAGGIGRAVAQAYSAAGARVFLASRSIGRLEEAKMAAPGIDITQLDATDAMAVDGYVDGIAREAGRIDISFNVIGLGDVQHKLMEITPEDFVQPIVTAARTQFLTTRAAARYMVEQKSGVVLMFGGGGPQTFAGLGGFKIALDAMEGMRRQWAAELGQSGIRVVTLKSGGVPESIGMDDAQREAIREGIEASSPMKRAASLGDVGAVAVFAASDQAASITDTWINIGFGSMPE
jgi:3-oxoacyl-[acyl-carrier protein] reductase